MKWISKNVGIWLGAISTGLGVRQWGISTMWFFVGVHTRVERRK